MQQRDNFMVLIDKAIEIRDKVATRWYEITKREPIWKIGLLERLKSIIRPSKISASMSFEEMVVEGNSIWSNRLGWGSAILIDQYITITPDVPGEYTILWGFEWYFDSIKSPYVSYDMYTQKETITDTTKIFLKDVATSTGRRPELDYHTYLDDIGLRDLGLTAGVTYTAKLNTRAKVTSPSGASITVEAKPLWSDTVMYRFLSATLSYVESKV
jgi:hypothetical protein